MSNPVSPDQHSDPFEVSRSDGEHVVLALRGELDLNSASELERELDAVFAAQDQRPLVMDVSELTFIDSTGLRVLVRANRRSTADNRELRLRGVTGQVRRLLEVTSLSSDFIILDH